VDYVRQLAPKSYLEIGCKFGGLMWAVAQVMPRPSQFVAVDLPNSHWGRSESLESLQACISHLNAKGHRAVLFIGDSTTPPIIENVRRLAPYDLIFIDANHTEPFVRKDFENYGKLAPVVCFHDIGWNNPTVPGRLPIEVPKVWASIKDANKTHANFREIKMDNGHNGIGIIEWH
jgi:cephalosporin hydroxylase